jgi:hypothetical protein
MCQALIFVSVVVVIAAVLLWVMRRALFHQTSLTNVEFGFKCVIGLAVANLLVGTAAITLMVMVNNEARQLEAHRAKYQPRVQSVLQTFESLADIQLIDGNFATMVAQFSTYDWKSMTEAVNDVSNNLYYYAVYNNDHTVGAIMSAIQSVTHQILGGFNAPINMNGTEAAVNGTKAGVSSAATGSDLAGQGGLVLEVLNYVGNFVQANTDASSYQTLGVSCANLAKKLRTVDWRSPYNCPTPRLPSNKCAFDFTSVMRSTLDQIVFHCNSLAF